jgi:hypothetical protein
MKGKRLLKGEQDRPFALDTGKRLSYRHVSPAWVGWVLQGVNMQMRVARERGPFCVCRWCSRRRAPHGGGVQMKLRVGPLRLEGSGH